MESENILQFIRMKNCPNGIKEGRYNHSIVTYQGSLYIFGGCKDKYTNYNDLLRYDVKAYSWSIEVTVGTLPSPRSGHTAVCYRSSMFVFGGKTNDGYFSNDLFEYQFSTRIWTKFEFTNCDLPVPRYLHCAAVYYDQLWIFGGTNGYKLTDMFKIRLTDNSSTWGKVLQKDEFITGKDFGACKMVVVCGEMFVFLRTSPQFITFNFLKQTWSKPTDMPISAQITPMVTSDQELIVLDESINVFHCYNLNSRNWSVITLESLVPELDIPKDLKMYETIGFRNAMYVFGGCHPGNATFHKLQWKHSYPECSLHEDYGKILETGLFADVEFIVGKQEIKFQAHIAITAARSEWLRSRIRDAQSVIPEELLMLPVRLPKMVSEVFELVLSYAYTDRMDQPNEENFLIYLELYNLAVQINLKRLAHLIILQLTDECLDGLITTSNVLDILSKAQNLGLFAVKEYCLRFIGNDSNYMDVVESKEFERLDNSLIIELVKRNPKSNVSFSISSSNGNCDSMQPTLAQDMEKFLNSGGHEFSDVTLLVRGESFPGHRCILAARSSYFAALFRSFMPSDNTVQINIGGIIPSKEAFHALLKYIYYGDVNVPIDQHSFILFAASDYYGFSSNWLQEIVKENLKHNGTFEQMAQLLQEAHLTQQIDMKRYLLGLIVECYPYTSSWPRTHTFASQELWFDIIEAGLCGDLKD